MKNQQRKSNCSYNSGELRIPGCPDAAYTSFYRLFCRSSLHTGLRDWIGNVQFFSLINNIKKSPAYYDSPLVFKIIPPYCTHLQLPNDQNKFTHKNLFEKEEEKNKKKRKGPMTTKEGRMTTKEGRMTTKKGCMTTYLVFLQIEGPKNRDNVLSDNTTN